jgi:Cu(I)/Ag(I) efflux system membrane fusion protein
MAFDDTGAWWLSEEEEILNPYFGDEMLHCGMVQEKF